MLLENNTTAALGFGCMRLPTEKGKRVDYSEFTQMIDAYIANGFNYFDTAHGYMRGKSEIAIKECLTSRYDRSKYVLANKLTDMFFSSEEEIEPFFMQQLFQCGVSYFDVYLLHGLTASIFSKYVKCNAFKILGNLRDKGKIRHLGISFHDRADILDKILTDYPQIELVQLQLNYLDYSDPVIQGRECHNICLKHNKPILVMEPCKGGSLIRLTEEAQAIYRDTGANSPAYYAFNYVKELEGVKVVLSGMSNLHQVQENCSIFSSETQMSLEERHAIDEVCRIYRSKDLIQCTSCNYCTATCPMSIKIPDIFSCLNKKRIFRNWNQDYYYRYAIASEGKASSCIRCGQCESRCPQHLPIRELLLEAAKEFERIK